MSNKEIRKATDAEMFNHLYKTIMNRKSIKFSHGWKELRSLVTSIDGQVHVKIGNDRHILRGYWSPEACAVIKNCYYVD